VQADAEFRAQLVKFGMEPYAPHTPEQFAAIVKAEQPRWQKAVRDSGAQVD
jgi:tripartite-type tricarboxylate transporter receptor subunit TctC